MDDAYRAKIEHIIKGNLGSALRMTLADAGDGICTVRMPTDGNALNAADRVHGGAITVLIDTAATGAAWAHGELGRGARGTTVSLTCHFLAAGGAPELVAEARVVRRGRSMVFIEIDVADSDGKAIAQGLVTYKLDPRP